LLPIMGQAEAALGIQEKQESISHDYYPPVVSVSGV